MYMYMCNKSYSQWQAVQGEETVAEEHQLKKKKVKYRLLYTHGYIHVYMYITIHTAYIHVHCIYTYKRIVMHGLYWK